MPTLLRAARMMGDPDKIITNLEGGTLKFTNTLVDCGKHYNWDSKSEGWRRNFPHARDVLDFVSIHLGTMYRLASERRHIDDAAAVVRFFEDRATREARRRTADDARSRDASLGLVSVCFDCSLDEPRGHRKTVEGMRLELEFVRAAVASLRSTCGAVVAGVMRAVAANETEWARAAGFDGVFVVDHHDIWHPPSNATGLGKRQPTSKRIYRPDRQHPVQTWLRFANAVRDLRDQGLGDADAIEWFGDAPRNKSFEFLMWGEQDQALIQRASNAALIAAVDDFCDASVGAIVPLRGVAYPDAPAGHLSPLRPAQIFANGNDLLENVSCCMPGPRDKFENSSKVDLEFPTVPLADRHIFAGGLRNGTGAGIEFILAASVNILQPSHPSAVCVPRRVARGGFLFDECAYAETQVTTIQA